MNKPMRSISMFNVGYDDSSVKTSLPRSTDVEAENSDANFETLLPRICTNFKCVYPVVVHKEIRKDDVKLLRKADVAKKSQKIKFVPILGASANSVRSVADVGLTMAGNFIDDLEDPNTVVVTSTYDLQERLVEIAVTKGLRLPRLVMQGIRLLAPFFEGLEKMSIRASRIDAYILHELNKIQSLSKLTEICLEDAPVPGGDYSVLLDHDVQYLTLCRCAIDDKACEQLASKFKISEVAERKLQILNLCSNNITDLGAKYLGEALRTNRTLRSLNLADNKITDDGAKHILCSLCQFSLTKEEIMGKRKRQIAYLKKRRDLVKKLFGDMSTDTIAPAQPQPSKTTTPTSNKKGQGASSKKETTKKDVNKDLETSFKVKTALIDELMGPYIEPFVRSKVVIKGDSIYSHGNFVLASLNLSYNKLSYLSLKEIERVLNYQDLQKMPNDSGLIRIVIEGNNLPGSCLELVNIHCILNRNLNKFQGKLPGSKKSSLPSVATTSKLGKLK